MKITKRQLKRIIKEEKLKLLKEITPGEAGIAAMGGGTPADRGFAAAKMDDYHRKKMQRSFEVDHGAFDRGYWSTIIQEEITDYLNVIGADYLDPGEAKSIEQTINAAANMAIMDLVED